MTTTISMPQLGETVTEGTILRWAKQVGDAVSEGEVVLEISTDKVDTEIPSPVSGVMLEILVPEGETVEVGRDLCVVGDHGGSVQEETPAPEMAESPPDVSPPDAEAEPSAPRGEQPHLPPTAVAAGRPGRSRRLSPVVRRLVRQHGIDLDLIAGTGEGGRVTRRDVEAYLEGGAQPVAAEPSEETPPAAPAPVAPPGEEERVDLSRLRVRIGENMIRSRQTAAHVWTSVEVDFEPIAEVRSAHKARFRREEGFSLTYLPFVCRAVMDALRAHPVVNSSFYLEDRKAVYHSRIDLGIAVDLDQQGLVVVTIRDADNLRLVGLARRIRHLSTAARNRQLGPDQMTGSTFTITNPGPFDSFLSAPIINVPNVAILSTDTVAKRPVVVTTADGRDALAIRHIGYLGFSWDHRAFDGSTAVLFLQRVKNNLETWDWEQELR
ncbi:MAG: dihydrolipoamide acetyltransferase family protein [bacterium]|nr:dihydrolipoamide acetyltransferase family protein [bacterium]